MTLLSVLPIVLSPAAMIAQQGSMNWLFTGFGATRTKTTTKATVRDLMSPDPSETSLYTLHSCLHWHLLPQCLCRRFRICVFTSPVIVAPRFRSAFSWANRAASCRNSAASIFCVSAWLSMLAATAVAVRKGAEPGAAWLAWSSMLSAAWSVRSSAESLSLSVLKLSIANASSMSIMVRSAELAAVVVGTLP